MHPLHPRQRGHGWIVQPTAASLDSQTVRASAHGGQVGYDAAKKTKGRKRFLLVDTLGLLLGVTLESADCPERKGARTLLPVPWPTIPNCSNCGWTIQPWPR